MQKKNHMYTVHSAAAGIPVIIQCTAAAAAGGVYRTSSYDV